MNSLTIDAHAHVFRHGLRLAAGRRYTPTYNAPLDRYLAQLDRHGLAYGVLVQPSFLGTDNAYLLDCLRRSPGRLRGVAVVDPAIPPGELLALRDAGVVGIRLNLIGKPLPDINAAAWRALTAGVRSLDWHLEVQHRAAGLAEIMPALLDADVPVVLDHFGLPDPATGAADPGFRQILTFGRSRRVWIKLSAPYRLGTDGESLAGELYPRLRDAFGLDRLMWGSDWPHTQFEATQTYEKRFQLAAEVISDDAEFATILTSPRALYHF